MLYLSFSSHQEVRKLDKAMSSIRIGDITYVREVTETDFSFLLFFLELFEFICPFRFNLHIF